MINIFNQIKRFKGLKCKENEHFEITLPKVQEYATTIENLDKIQVGNKYHILVKKYMTQPATKTFNFHQQWNNGIPMPCEHLSGKITKETKGMYYFESETWSGYIIKTAITFFKQVKE